jgi:hypothetical protein
MRFFPGDDAYSVSRLPPLSSWDASRCIGALDAKGECLATLPAMTQFNPLKLGSNPELNSSAQTASCVHVISRALGRCRLATRRFTVYRFPYGRIHGIERLAALRKFNDPHGREDPRRRLAAPHRAHNAVRARFAIAPRVGEKSVLSVPARAHDACGADARIFSLSQKADQK